MLKTILFLVTLSLSLTTQAEPYRIVVDPGHGGMDTGASLGAFHESDITLQISKKVKEEFKENINYEVYLTRETDKIIPLIDRTELSKKKKADLFISIHANSSPDLGAKGAEFYFQSQMPPDEETLFLANRENSEIASNENTRAEGDLAAIIEDIQKTSHVYASQILAETLLQKWKKNFQVRPQSIKQGPFRVLVDSVTPSVLIEVGYITNAKDRSDLTQSEKQKKMAEIIYKAVVEFKEKMDKGHFSGHIISHANR